MNREVEARVEKWLSENLNPFSNPRMAWVDIETTGLDFDNDMMIEVGFLLTDANGNVVNRGVFESVIYNPEGVDWSKSVDPFVVKMHESSQLTRDLEQTTSELHGIEEVETSIVKFLKSHFGPGVKDLRLPLCGSSVHFDRQWLINRMPKVADLFSHRIIDVSSDDEKAKAKGLPRFLDTPGAFKTMHEHRVIPDLIDSIEQYRFYNPSSPS